MQIRVQAYGLGGLEVEAVYEVASEQAQHEAAIDFYRRHVRTVSAYRSKALVVLCEDGTSRGVHLSFRPVCADCGQTMYRALTRSRRMVECECGHYVSLTTREGQRCMHPYTVVLGKPTERAVAG